MHIATLLYYIIQFFYKAVPVTKYEGRPDSFAYFNHCYHVFDIKVNHYTFILNAYQIVVWSDMYLSRLHGIWHGEHGQEFEQPWPWGIWNVLFHPKWTSVLEIIFISAFHFYFIKINFETMQSQDISSNRPSPINHPQEQLNSCKLSASCSSPMASSTPHHSQSTPPPMPTDRLRMMNCQKFTLVWCQKAPPLPPKQSRSHTQHQRTWISSFKALM